MIAKVNTVKILGLGGALLLAVLISGCASSGDKPRVRVYEEKQYIQLRHVPDTAAQMDLKKGDATAMVCGKCKTVWYQRLTSPSSSFWYPAYRRGLGGYGGYGAWESQRRAYEDWQRRHYCPGCKSTITVTGSWLNGKETVKHTCDACGSDSVFCCATSKDAPPTEGMQPKTKP